MCPFSSGYIIRNNSFKDKYLFLSIFVSAIRSVKPTMRQNIVKYMKRAAERPAFASAFGEDHAALVVDKTKSWGAGEKMFGIF